MMCREVPVQRFNRSLLLAAFCCVAPSVSALAGTLPAPTITSIVIDSPRVEVSWNLVEGATRYEVQARQGEDGRWQSWAFVGAKHNSATITGFAPSTQYYVRVRASNLSESSEFSPPAPLSVGQILRPPSVPTNLRLIELAYKNVVIGWDAPEFAAGYAITVREASSDSATAVELWGHNSTNLTLFWLKSQTDYYFRVLARGNGLGDSELSPEFKVTTLPQPPAVATVTFQGAATNLNGNWPEYFGAEGYAVAGGSTWFSKDFLTGYRPGSYTWKLPAMEGYAPFQDPGRTDRVAATFLFYWANAPTRIFCDEPCEVTFYFLDWQGFGGGLVLRLIDEASDRVMAQRPISSFQNGIYVSYQVLGKVRVEFGTLDAFTAYGAPMLSGIFFGGPVRTAKAKLSLLPKSNLLTLTIAAPAGRSYTLEKSTDFSNWTGRSSGRLDVPEASVTLDPRDAPGRAFFRVKLE